MITQINYLLVLFFFFRERIDYTALYDRFAN